jgi:hypothetical protein
LVQELRSGDTAAVRLNETALLFRIFLGFFWGTLDSMFEQAI